MRRSLPTLPPVDPVGATTAINSEIEAPHSHKVPASRPSQHGARRPDIGAAAHSRPARRYCNVDEITTGQLAFASEARSSSGSIPGRQARARGLTRDTILPVVNPEVSIRDLRNHGGEVIDRVIAGEKLTVTRSGRPVAELRPLAVPPLRASVILEHWSRLPRIDLDRLREQLDAAISPSL